jgi:hypothetical protein
MNSRLLILDLDETLVFATEEKLARGEKVKRLGWSLEGVAVIDDSPEKLKRSYGNHIRVAPFVGDPTDNELPKLQGYLAWLKEVPNVRLVDKRNWRTAPVA